MNRECQLCRFPFPDTVKFCTECGGRTVEKSQAMPGSCPCGYVNIPNAKFCAECGKTIGSQTVKQPVQEYESFRPSAVKQGATQVTGFQEYQERITSPRGTPEMTHNEREDALRREEERMNKKAGNTQDVRYGRGGLAGVYAQPVVQQTQPEPELVRAPSKPLYAPVKSTTPISVDSGSQQYQVPRNISNINLESTFENLAAIRTNANSGIGTFCVIDIHGNPHSSANSPKLDFQLNQSSAVFSAIPGRFSISLECTVEDSTLIKFSILSTIGDTLVKKYRLPCAIGCQNLRREGNSVVLEL